MLSELEQTRELVDAINGSLWVNVAEMTPTIQYIRDHENEAGPENSLVKLSGFFNGVLYVVDRLANFSDQDITLIEKVDEIAERKGVTHNSTSHISAGQFVHHMGKKRLGNLVRNFENGMFYDRGLRDKAIEDLALRMIGGSNYKRELNGAKPTDSDPRTHTLIFGHTREDWNVDKYPLALFRFAGYHLMERLFQAIYADDSDQEVQNLARTKDTFLNALDGSIRVLRLQGREIPDVTRDHERSRSDGGVGWTAANKKTIYNGVYQAVVVNTLE